MADIVFEDRIAGLIDRSGLPEDVRVLVDRYPRESWDNGNPVGDLGRFWIERHNAFRNIGAALVDSIVQLREEKVTAGQFAGWFGPRLSHFLGDLHGHHQIEDFQYFPLFAAADRRLAKGFDLLEGDHHIIHAALERNANAGQSFYDALVQGRADLPYARDAYAAEAELLLKGLMRHLDDEEDLIIPLLMEQGEDRFY